MTSEKGNLGWSFTEAPENGGAWWDLCFYRKGYIFEKRVGATYYARVVGAVYVGPTSIAREVGRQIKSIMKEHTPGWDLECLLRDL